jgi:hypothetical protein
MHPFSVLLLTLQVERGAEAKLFAVGQHIPQERLGTKGSKAKVAFDDKERLEGLGHTPADCSGWRARQWLVFRGR